MTSGVRRAVAVGGGTGLPTVLRCLLDLGMETSAVVTMADDGGSSGLLRRELGILPPGDARNCLVALAEPGSLLGRVLQYRFPHGDGLAGHALGNLFLAALTDIMGGFPQAVAAAEGLLGARGHVYPSTLEDVVLHAMDKRGRPVSGQANIARSSAPVARVCAEPEDPAAYPPASESLSRADVVIVGPGSLFTSLIPNFLVRGIAEALRGSEARRVYLCNVANQRGETSAMDAADHVDALLGHGLRDAIDVVIVHDSEKYRLPDEVDPVRADARVLSRIADLGMEVVSADLVDEAHPTRHSQEKLLSALRGVA